MHLLYPYLFIPLMRYGRSTVLSMPARMFNKLFGPTINLNQSIQINSPISSAHSLSGLTSEVAKQNLHLT